MLTEKYRPETLSEFIGNESWVKRLAMMAERGAIAGKVFWITGESGTGKTSLARIISRMVSSEIGTTEIDAADLRIDTIREFESRCRYRTIEASRPLHAFIVNESHRLRGDIVTRLLTTFEAAPVQRNSVWIFTTTDDGSKRLFADHVDHNPFLSRATVVPLNSTGLVELFAKRAQEIARAEGLDGRPLRDYVDLLMSCKRNMRAALNRIESGEMLQ